MRELSQWVFEAAQGEDVSLQINSVGFEGNFVGVGLDSMKLDAALEKPDNSLHFKVSKPPGLSYRLIFEFNFPTYARDDACYEVNLSGSQGGSFRRFVYKRDTNHDRDLVVAIGETEKAASQEGQQPEDAASEPKSRDVLAFILEKDTAVSLLNALVVSLGAVPGPASDSKAADSDDWRTGPMPSPIAEETKEWRKEVDDEGPYREGIIEEAYPADDGPSDPPNRAKKSDPRNYKRAKPPAIAREHAEARPANGESSPEVAAASDDVAAAAPRRSRPRFVNVGFAAEQTPSKRIKKDISLACDRPYFFWLEVGQLLQGNIDTAPEPLTREQAPPDALLKVVLFPFRRELQIKRGADIGALKVLPDSTVVVEQPVARPETIKPGSPLLKRRLFFPVRTPKRTGVFRLRCNIYHKQVLVQSRLVTARVMPRSRPAEGALRATVDYRLARTFSASHLAGIEPHRLSIMLNDNGDGTHGLRFWGGSEAAGPEFKQDATISGQKLQDLVRQARGGLRKISWNDEDQWQSTKTYLYDRPRSFDEFKGDLIALAKRGYKFYDGIIDDFTKGASQSADDLAELMLKPGNVQIALKESANLLIPASLIYDYPLDDGLKSHKLCAAFVKDFKGTAPLEKTDCFNGLCPSRTSLDTVCPSGFWGYRHLIGLPLSLAGAENAPTQIDWQGAPQLTVAVSTNLEFYQQHQKALEKQFKAKWPALGWNYAESRAATFEYMKNKAPQLVYFYCHGGLENNAPYIKVGPQTEDKFTRANLRAYHIRWTNPRPLVFINGCHTTAVEPEQALEFVSAFVETANASGVIGTEITVFEKLARKFAEDCLQRFVVEGQSIGEAIRGARLARLKEGNPLGLVYIPFVMANLKLKQSINDN